jgi:CubicO group peptidase (beta-lactamase class C family)
MGSIGRRRFLGAGIATATAALVVPKTIAVAQPTPTPDATAATTPDAAPATTPVPPDAQSLVTIPPGRVDAALRGLDGLIQQALSRTGVPGLAAAVVHRGRLRYAKGFGVRSVDTGVPVNARTVFRLASVSKSLSATVVSGIVGRKLARWSDPVVKYLPSFALSDPYVTKHVTICDLFSHRSGLPDHAGDLLEDLGYVQDYILHALRLEPLDPFRDAYAYTNFGLTAAAVAAAGAAGSDWPTISDRLVFGPLRR